MLKLSNLNCGYKNKHVLSNIEFNINKAETLFLVGPNGSGKSTLLKTIFGLLEPLSGSSITQSSNRIAMLEANPQAVFSISVNELFQINPTSKKLNEVVIQLFNLKDMLQQDILTLSSGQAQLVWLAHVLSLGSELVLLDEPFTHLDWSHQKQAADALRYFKKTYHTTFVIAAHELSLAVELADQVAALASGRLCAYGSPREVFENKIMGEVFDFKCFIDENPIDGSRRLTIGKRND